MSPETGPSIGPQFDRGGRFVENLISPSPMNTKRRCGDLCGRAYMQYSSRLCFLCLALLASTSLFAQSGATGEFDQILVTGARTPLASGQLGSAATVITRADIEQRQAHYVTDLLRAVPGFAISHTGVTGSQIQVRVRGAEANHVLVLD